MEQRETKGSVFNFLFGLVMPGWKKHQMAEDTGTENVKNSKMEQKNGEMLAQEVTLKGKVILQPITTRSAKPKIKHTEKLRSKSESLMIYCTFCFPWPVMPSSIPTLRIYLQFRLTRLDGKALPSSNFYPYKSS